jgi:hypothetical protein
MRYLLLQYFKKPDGKYDEAMTVVKNLKSKDIQESNVILDFKELKVVTCSIEGQQQPKDWEVIVAYYYQFYPAVIERLFQENGFALETMTDEQAKEAGVTPGVQNSEAQVVDFKEENTDKTD